MNFCLKIRNSKNQYNLLDQKSSQSNSNDDQEKSTEKANQNIEWLTELYTSKEKFLKFLSEIQSEHYTPLREDVLGHFEHNPTLDKIYQLDLNSQSVLKLLNARIQKMIKNKRIKKNWSQQDIFILTWLISKYADKYQYINISKDLVDQDWEFISTLIPGINAETCMFKWLSLKKVSLATNNWSREESNLLSEIVKQIDRLSKKDTNVKDWKLISQKLYKIHQSQSKIFRNAKQCRQHWNCYLNPNLKKGPWRLEQDIKLLKKVIENKGSKKWSQIVKQFDGRTQNALKNRFTLIIQKQKKNHKGKTQMQLIEEYLQKCYADQLTAMMNSQTNYNEPLKQIKLSSFCEESCEKISEQLINDSCKKEQQQKQKYETPAIMSMNSIITSATPGIMTPVKIQKFKKQTFENLSKSFLKYIQPGIINSDGSFRQLSGNILFKKIES